MDLSDRDLILAYRRGQRASFDLLVVRYLKTVYSVVFYYVKNVQDAEDLTQDVFVKVMVHLEKFNGEKPFKPWILRIARNQALDWIKKKKPLLAAGLPGEDEADFFESVPDPAPLADTLANQKLDRDRLLTALAELSPSEQQVVLQKQDAERSFQEIANASGQGVDTVKSRYRRALLKLRKILKKDQ